jgi:hypothetical protein
MQNELLQRICIRRSERHCCAPHAQFSAVSGLYSEANPHLNPPAGFSTAAGSSRGRSWSMRRCRMTGCTHGFKTSAPSLRRSRSGRWHCLGLQVGFGEHSFSRFPTIAACAHLSLEPVQMDQNAFESYFEQGCKDRPGSGMWECRMITVCGDLD